MLKVKTFNYINQMFFFFVKLISETAIDITHSILNQKKKE